jgi:conjugative relaxase-like TrwC/TraI family protein
MMGIHKLTAGDGYLYLVRQVAAADATAKGRISLSDYYSSKGESPGVWTGRGLAGLGAPARAFHDEQTATAAMPAGVPAKLTKLERKTRDAAARAAALWAVEDGSTVTEDQMRSLFGLGVHPNAVALTDALMEGKAGKAGAAAAVKLGRPFRISPGDTELNRRLAVAYRDHNLSLGKPWNTAIDAALRAQMKTTIAGELFAEQYGRAPADDRELSGFIARESRELTTSTAGYDLTFSPVKSVSTLWALAPIHIAAVIEKCHDLAVNDALEFLQDEACFTRVGAQGVAQVDTDGFIAARFTHRDSRAGDPDLHTHVAVSNKVRATGSGQWLALDGRPLFRSTVAASELYNTRLEGYLAAELSLRFAERGDAAEGVREVREIVGIPARLNEGFSARRTAIDARSAELSKAFQADHGREPSTPEALALAQQATLETRQAKHEPRSLAEQRQAWRSQATVILGDSFAVGDVVSAALSGSDRAAPPITDEWIAQAAAEIIATVSTTRSTWQRTHVFAQAQRVARAAGLAADHTIAARLTEAALCEPFSVALGLDATADLGEPQVLRRRDGSSVYRVHNAQSYTSQELLEAEARILRAAALTDGRRARPEDVEMALLAQAANRRELNDGQAALVRAMACSGHRVSLALAPAGAGKTTAMAALARAWEDSGGTVIGLSPSANAAQILRAEIDVEVADTVDKFTHMAANPDGGHHDPARRWFDSIDSNTLLIVDEAGKAGTLALDMVIAIALVRGASVRLIGDDRQLASISAGGVLRDLAETTELTTLSQIMRFASAAEAQAGAALRVGDPAGLAFYADRSRIHVGAADTAAAMAFEGWRADQEAGLDSLLLAPTNEIATDLNAQARLWRLTREAQSQTATESAAAVLEARLADGLSASVGDTVITKTNDRTLPLGRRDFVRNGYRWTVTGVSADGSMMVTHNDSGQHLRLPAHYVKASVRLGYAATIDSAQGATARHRCHTVGHDRLNRQQVYTALSRGVVENHIYLSTAETDPHRVLSPAATHPDTAIDVLTRALARDGAQVSATTLRRRDADPFLGLAADVNRYNDAVGSAAEALLTAEQNAALDTNSEFIYAGITRCQGWPVLRKHLALIAANGGNPLQRLAEVVERGGLDDAADAAAVVDWRLDPTGAHSGGTGPLPWLPGLPAGARGTAAWHDFLAARHIRVSTQVAAIRDAAATWIPATAPRWARPLLDADRDLLADLAVFRAATAVPDEDTRIAGPQVFADRARAEQDRLETRSAAIIGRPDTETGRYNDLLDALNPDIRRDPYWPQLAAHLASAARTGVNIHHLVTAAVDQGPLPDELPAAALWWRISGTLSPAALDTATPGLRPVWLPDLASVFGTGLAETIVSDTAFPALVSAVAAADPQRWTPLDLLNVAAEHLADADRRLTRPIRPDEYARLLTYSIDLFTAPVPYERDLDAEPVQAEPPMTPDEEEALHQLNPDPAADTFADQPHPARIDFDRDDDALLAALGVDLEEAPPEDESLPLDYHDLFSPFEPGSGFADQYPRAVLPEVGLRPALDDVCGLRDRCAATAAAVEALASQVETFHGPAVAAAMPEIRALRERADADRPYLSAVQEVLAQWSDADDAYEAAVAARVLARDYLVVLTAAPDTAAEDLEAARAHYEWARARVPDTAPATAFFADLTAAKTAREVAAGGAGNIVTHADADAVLAAANAADRRDLQDARSELRRLRQDLTRAETIAARSFAAAQLTDAAHIAEQMEAIGTELRVLGAAGDLITQPRLTLPEGPATLTPMTADGVARLAATPFALSVVHASARARFLDAMRLLHTAAATQNRPVLWCDAAADGVDDTAAVADTRAALTDTHRDLQAGWRPEPGTLLVVDHAADASPEVIADLAEAAAAAQTRVILIDTDLGRRWPAPPSAALLRLLQADLPWAVTLSVDTRPLTWVPAGPDLDPALVRAGDLAPHLHTPDIAAAVARHHALRTALRTAHTIDARGAAIAERDRDQGDGGRTRRS